LAGRKQSIDPQRVLENSTGGKGLKENIVKEPVHLTMKRHERIASEAAEPAASEG
jgi:hypothetical protein